MSPKNILPACVRLFFRWTSYVHAPPMGRPTTKGGNSDTVILLRNSSVARRQLTCLATRNFRLVDKSKDLIPQRTYRVNYGLYCTQLSLPAWQTLARVLRDLQVFTTILLPESSKALLCKMQLWHNMRYRTFTLTRKTDSVKGGCLPISQEGCWRQLGLQWESSQVSWLV